MPAMLHNDLALDLSGLTCPMPLLKTKQALNRMETGQVLMVTATDPASERDFQAFSQQSGVPLLQAEKSDGKFTYWLRKP
jgi:tRNA 2-thiouridine synthesizing protein A